MVARKGLKAEVAGNSKGVIKKPHPLIRKPSAGISALTLIQLRDIYKSCVSYNSATVFEILKHGNGVKREDVVEREGSVVLFVTK